MKKGYISKPEIESLKAKSYSQIVSSINSGEYSEKFLRKAYTQLRDIAQKRLKRISDPEVVKQFGKVNLFNDGEYFRKLKNIVTTGDLVRELSDITKFLRSERSTISGLKAQREKVKKYANALGFDVEDKTYLKFIKFITWFKASEFSKYYDSDSEEVTDVFNSSEKASPRTWKNLFKELIGE